MVISTIKKLFLLMVFFVVLFFLLSFVNSKNYSNDTSQKNYWHFYDKRVDYVTKDGVLIRDENIRRAITILPSGYEEKNIPYKIISYSFADKVEKEHVIFESIPEFTVVKILPNSIDASKLWILPIDEENCLRKKTTSKNDLNVKGICQIYLYEYNLITNKISEKTLFSFRYSDFDFREFDLLVHDPVKNVVWMNAKYILSQDDVLSLKGKNQDITNLDRTYAGVSLLSYEANYDVSGVRDTLNHLSMSNKSLPYHKTQVQTDKNGQLYFVAACGLGCKKDGLFINSLTKRREVPIFYYGYDDELLGYKNGFQITIDTENSKLYLVTNSFNQDSPSQIFLYDIEREKTIHIGRQPTNENDDVLGIDTVDGRLAIGTYGGLAIYNYLNDNWKIINQTNGIKSNIVEGVYAINNGGICILHKNNGASCLFEPLSRYVDSLESK